MSLASILLRFVFLIEQVLLTILGIGVNCDFTIGSEYFAVIGKHQWVDLYHVAILCHEAIIDASKHFNDLIGVFL